MPQFLNTLASPEVEAAIREVATEGLPQLTATTWAQEIQKNGGTPSALAQMYMESLNNMKASQRPREIRELLGSLGITKTKEDQQKFTPSVTINGENIQIIGMLVPQREGF
jgi:hypothetical protein